MPIKINVKKSVNDNAIKNYVLFSDEEFKINSLNRLSLGRFSGTLNKMINLNSSKKKVYDFISTSLFLSFLDISSKLQLLMKFLLRPSPSNSIIVLLKLFICY